MEVTSGGPLMASPGANRSVTHMKQTAHSPSPFARVAQIGVIVRDLEAATAFYEALGLGPFKMSAGAAPIVDREVYGKAAPDVKNRIATTRLGEVELELVQPVSGASMQREFLERHGEGVNHLGFVVEDLEEEVSKLVAKGFRLVSRGKVQGGGAFVYLDTDRVGGVIFELMQVSDATP